MTPQEALARFRAELPAFMAMGVSFEDGMPLPTSYLPDAYARNIQLAMDAQPAIQSLANAGVPSLFTTFVNPNAPKGKAAPKKK
jgi:hypothetical protein